MTKLILNFMFVMVCFTAFAKSDTNTFTKISLPFFGIDMKMPTILLGEKADNFRIKDGKYTATFVFIKKGRKAIMKNFNKNKSFISSMFSSDSSIMEERDSYRAVYTRIFKYGTDGYIMASFAIDKNKELSKSTINKYIELSKNALDSISYSEKNVELMAELPFNVSPIKGDISYRGIQTISFQKRGNEKIVVSISYYQKNGGKWRDDYPLDWSYMKDQCEKKVISYEPAKVVVGVKASVKKTSQKCQVGKHYVSKKSTATRYDTSFFADNYEVVVTYLNRNSEEKDQSGLEFYQEVSDNIKKNPGVSYASGVQHVEQAALVKKSPPLMKVKPVAKVEIADGKKIYETSCYMCHEKGVAGAPVLGNKKDWAIRIPTGIESLYDSALHGKGSMPPRGGGMSLSDEEVKAAVDYMVDKI